MNFEESKKYLYGLGNEVLAMKLGLENIRTLLAALDNPEKKYMKVQVAGTNGKGSTVAFLESICASAEIKVGATTSPHLISITERVRIDGEEISEKDFARCATVIRETSEKLVEKGELETVPTFFEQVTAIALYAFAEAEVELAILETGLGGRFDATTAANSEIAAITPIDYDHQQILGNTLEQIAAEKAAIIRSDTRVVSAPQKAEAEKVIYGKCREVGAEPIWAIPNVRLIEKVGDGTLYLSFNTKKTNYKAALRIQGRHQWTNAALAVCIAEILCDFNFRISKESVENGLETAEHKGRLEFWFNHKGFNILFDGAHNVAGAKALKEYLDEFVSEPVTMIFAAMNDKDLTEIGDILFPKASNLILTKPENQRSMDTAELLKFVPENLDKEKVFVTETVEESIRKANELSWKNELILITGSLYLVGEAQKLLNNQSQI